MADELSEFAELGLSPRGPSLSAAIADDPDLFDLITRAEEASYSWTDIATVVGNRLGYQVKGDKVRHAYRRVQEG